MLHNRSHSVSHYPPSEKRLLESGYVERATHVIFILKYATQLRITSKIGIKKLRQEVEDSNIFVSIK